MSIVYLNGEYVPAESAMVSVDDRGFLFADACYEVTAVHRGRLIALDRHLDRLRRGLRELRIDFDAGTLVDVHQELIRRNGLADSEAGSVYVQVSRGAAPRALAFPDDVHPTVYAKANVLTPSTHVQLAAGSGAVTYPDIRWGRVDIKTVGLLANVLAQQHAVAEGVADVILHRDGVVTEGARTNVFAVIDGVIVTAPADHRILAGVTRGIVLELARSNACRVEEREWGLDELTTADEVFMTSTTAGVRSIVDVDGTAIGDGARGQVTLQLQALYRAFVSDEFDG